MKSWVNLCGQGLQFCAHCVLSLFLWTLWLALSLLLAFEIWIATSRELAVPGFVLRAFEERLALSHVQVKFGRTHFDPSGRVLVEDLRVFLPAFTEPVLISRSVQLEIDPWALAAGRFEPRILHLSGGSLAIPAMLSTSGQPDEIIRDLDVTLHFEENRVLVDHLTARVAGIAVKAHGGLNLAPTRTAGQDVAAARRFHRSRPLSRALPPAGPCVRPARRARPAPARTRAHALRHAHRACGCHRVGRRTETHGARRPEGHRPAAHHAVSAAGQGSRARPAHPDRRRLGSAWRRDRVGRARPAARLVQTRRLHLRPVRGAAHHAASFRPTASPSPISWPGSNPARSPA